MKTALSSITYSNNAATIDATINATNDATNDASNDATIDAITIGTKDSSASGRLCLGDSTVKEPSVSIKNAYSPEITGKRRAVITMYLQSRSPRICVVKSCLYR